ncbi:Loss of respiratory capacity protein 2 [Lachancea thermotolerans]|uniref:KLTH0G10648p n=1 Tax=Lachancea thermotolerans (strain ATCC 56472 / CBS 6340 / NRRL Y-8284) TaxID=559295 RepID=C5DMP8_LACTC|nr:KLTH0G10648p [Lachancea thermotolerans CBS 6340]CAR25059.1 KLTH0G10648p [Lachancea thermotolerans CBS 6340]
MSASDVRELSSTPYPALANSLMLLATPVVSPAANAPARQAAQGAGWSRFGSFWSRPKLVGPSTKTALLFGAAQAVGSWIIYDGDLESGSGFLGAWSALYLIVGGRGSISALRYGRVWPLALSAAALSNTLLYARRFISGGFT